MADNDRTGYGKLVHSQSLYEVGALPYVPLPLERIDAYTKLHDYAEDRIKNICTVGILKPVSRYEVILVSTRLNEKSKMKLDISKLCDVASVDIKSEDIELNEIEWDKIESDRIESDEIEPDKIESDKIESDKIEPDKIESDKIEWDKIEPDTIEPDKMEPDKMEPDKIEPDKMEPDKMESVMMESDMMESDNIESDEIECDEIEPDPGYLHNAWKAVRVLGTLETRSKGNVLVVHHFLPVTDAERCERILRLSARLARQRISLYRYDPVHNTEVQLQIGRMNNVQEYKKQYSPPSE